MFTGLCSRPHRASEEPASGLPSLRGCPDNDQMPQATWLSAGWWHWGGVVSVLGLHWPCDFGHLRCDARDWPAAAWCHCTPSLSLFPDSLRPLHSMSCPCELSLFRGSCSQAFGSWSWRRVPWASERPTTPTFPSAPCAVSCPNLLPSFSWQHCSGVESRGTPRG